MRCRVELGTFIPADILETFAVLERQSLDLARRFATSVVDTLDWLAENAQAGSPKLFDDPRLSSIRSWQVRTFERNLILYRVHDDKIEVLAIVHGSRDLEALLLVRV